MQCEINEIKKWSKNNHMNINTRKTKEMLIGHIKNEPLQALQLNDIEIESVSAYKLLGQYVNNRLTWDDHETSICCKSV